MVSESTIAVNGVELNVLEAGAGPLVILSHGFPELGYSWRHQLPAIAEAGYHVIAPDQRGYGKSTRPDAISDYDIEHLSGDLVGLMDHFGDDQAIIVGHDWGSMVVWQTALLHPDRVKGVVGMSVPFMPRGPVSPITAMRNVFGDNFFYILYFQEPGVADADLGADAAKTMRRMLTGVKLDPNTPMPSPELMAANDGKGFVDRMPEPKGLPDWLTQEELDHYSTEFARTGFTGGINWYRNFDRNWERTPQLAGQHIKQPSMFVGGALDPVLMMTPAGTSDEYLDDFRGNVLVPDAGHWVQQEKPDEVNEALIGFIHDVTKGN